ncbi:MAG: insulinase family protein [Gemmatimonadaceae bacterium]|nr:insulinase family protein [Gemmatimonadaceae bacterium]
MRYRYLGLAFAALFASAASAQKAPKVRIDFVEETLPNGLHVIYSVDKSTPLIAVEVMYNVGSKNEPVGRTGFAHLFEHVMFKGSKNVADGDHYRLLERVGARTGQDYNGTTSFDRTNYFEQIPSQNLELALWLEADRMGTLTETLTQAKLDNQREVVKNEKRQSYDNQPYGSWLEKLMSNMYPEANPYHHLPIGSMEDLTAASLDDIKSFFKTYYAPNNAVLVVVGDFDLANAKSLVRKQFAWIPRGPMTPAVVMPPLAAKLGAPKREVVNDPNAPAPQVYVAYRMPSGKSKENAAVSLLSGILGGGRSSPLYDYLVRQKQAAVGVSAFNFDIIDAPDIMAFVATGKQATNPDSLEASLLDGIDAAIAKIDQTTLDRVRAQARYSFVNSLQLGGGLGASRADALAESYTYFKDAGRVNRVLSELDAVTVTQLRALAKEQLVPENRFSLVYVPRRASSPAGTN